MSNEICQEQKEDSAGKKFDKNKPSLELLPPSYWIEVNSEFSVEMSRWYFDKETFPSNFGFDPIKVLEYGKLKYAAHNWRKGMQWGRLVGAFHRHCNSFDLVSGLWLPRDLTELDEESFLPHGSHAECCRIFLQEFYRQWSKGNLVGTNDCAWNV